ncbi:hypothetical protein CW683_01260 [Macrococcoides caseolyticum]|nr:hypothetical protein CW683_01260 [Macrococcus caseolyticus]
MIKVGDKITSKQTGITYTVKDIDNKVIWVNGGGYLLTDDLDKFETPYESPDYKQLYEQQKQRADELEKRWSKLVDVLNKKYEYYKVRADDESAGPIEQGKWKIAKHELMMVLKIMTDLKRGETE